MNTLRLGTGVLLALGLGLALNAARPAGSLIADHARRDVEPVQAMCARGGLLAFRSVLHGHLAGLNRPVDASKRAEAYRLATDACAVGKAEGALAVDAAGRPPGAWLLERLRP